MRRSAPHGIEPALRATGDRANILALDAFADADGRRAARLRPEQRIPVAADARTLREVPLHATMPGGRWAHGPR